MKRKSGTIETFQEVRKKAENLLSKFAVDQPDIAPDNYQKIIHDLQMHQIELALQNEELRETQLKLEESRAQFVDLYDHAPVGYFSFDEKGRILSVNLAGCLQLGLERNALLKKPFPSFMRQEDSDLFYLHLKKVAATRKKQTCALTLRHENGTFYAQLDSIPSAILPGKSPLFQTTVTDITERKTLEEAVQVSETRYRRLFETAREGILILDAETGEIADVNPFLTEMLGYSHQELLGKKLWELGCFKDIKASKAAYKQLWSKGYARYDNLPLETKNRRIITVEFVSSLYFINELNFLT